MLNKKPPRQSEPINAGSMADIAFLLLIFFLVTATIAEDQGIFVKLPPWEPDPVPITLNQDNVLSVNVNGKNELLVEGEITTVDRLKDIAKVFIANPNGEDNKPKSPKNAIVSIMNDRGTNYATYLAVYNEIKAAYSELWEAAAQKNYGRTYVELPIAHQKSIRAEIPLVISEAEPTEY
ncbi:ExbD/TolR family protein [Flavilitoribacter nigricans]|uniref:Biopolymer transporter ExbD n=1 Tax=Flavilitoribacter nigricans (strain ATCC 23147 / DSM 23189 / NBRC 102662 / NCIMB 1420 / SS-2) TaxID=1122177 RepID=A0A2D0N776_FLAN2|nr:biopolymer transporter ExbD [Flavilitoribacter nigricans]PHN03979.1 biopolymer transporter ExbD [Flavilitoribacter nigricans DSM 23189 = NBRC 102662]